MRVLVTLLILLGPATQSWSQTPGPDRPNILLIMTDDQGWADTGYQGHEVLKTPALDAMAREGMVFTWFYAQAPVCSPTRASVLTGRHPSRYGITGANTGHLPADETNLAQILRGAGYTTGFFGKWHLGTLTKTIKDSNRGGPRGAAHYAPPWDRGFDVCFATEAKVPTWDPMLSPGTDEPYGTRYWAGPDQIVEDNLLGDDSRVIADRVIPFIEESARAGTPFLAVVWFHTPHRPTIAGEKYLAMYEGRHDANYLGAVTAMDEQVGRIRATLKRTGVSDDTIVWFCSDNGPEIDGGNRTRPAVEYADSKFGSAMPLRGRKRSLYEGGIRVPGLLVWPARVEPRTTAQPCSTTDILPTILNALGIERPHSARPLDGVSLNPALQDDAWRRNSPIGFWSRRQMAWMSGHYKLITTNDGETFELYDLSIDPAESNDLASSAPHLADQMSHALTAWIASCRADQARLEPGN